MLDKYFEKLNDQINNFQYFDDYTLNRMMSKNDLYMNKYKHHQMGGATEPIDIDIDALIASRPTNPNAPLVNFDDVDRIVATIQENHTKMDTYKRIFTEWKDKAGKYDGLQQAITTLEQQLTTLTGKQQQTAQILLDSLKNMNGQFGTILGQ